MQKNTKQMGKTKNFDFTLEPGKMKSSRISMNKGTSLITVITICSLNSSYNYVVQMMNSLINQTFPYWEWIIVINDNKSDIINLKNIDKRIKIIVYDYETIAKAKIEAIKNSSTELIFNFEENDLLNATMLECGFFAMMLNYDADFSYSRVVEFGKKELLINNKLRIIDEKKKNIIAPGIFIKKQKFLELEKYEKITDDLPRQWYTCIELLSKKAVPLKMEFYGYWHRNLNAKKQDEKITPEMQEEIDKIDDKLNTIQFDNNYEVDYKNIPTIIDLKKPPVVPADGKKRILFILPWTAIGGAEIFDFNLIKGLKQKNYEISVITTQKTEHDLRQEIEQYVEEYFDLSTFLKKKDWASFVAYIIKSRRINLVFFSNSYYGYYALPWLKCQFKEIPFVDYIHSENWTLRNGGKPKDSNAVADYLDATYTCTEYLKNLMYKTMKRNVKNVKTVYIGTDTDYFNPEFESEKYDELKEKYKGKKVILLPCRIVHAKRPIFAINVIKKLAEIRDDVRLAIVGDGVALKDVKNYIIENNLQNIVECFGYQKDVRPFYKVASATIICSLQEGLALVAYESMAMGVPVVSANIGGQSELIDEECGALVPVYQKLEEQLNFNYSDEEIEKYVTKFLEIFDKLENTDIKEKCREKVVNGFSISKMINTMDKEFTRLIKSGSKIDKNLLKIVELAERYLLVHGVLESKDEREKR